MKDLKQYITEATFDDINKFYVDIKNLKNGNKYFVGICDGENNESRPAEVVFKQEGKEFIFVNPDDDREMFDWHDLINSTNDKEEPQVAIFKNKKEAKDYCEYYNDINDM